MTAESATAGAVSRARAVAPGDPGRVGQAGQARSTRIEALRALAALGVLVGHAYGYAHAYGPEVYRTFLGRVLLGGGFGVFLFFALTGYLLFLPFARAMTPGVPGVSLGGYALNRALRVLPLYYVVITVYLAVRGGPLQSVWWRFALLVESFWPNTVARVDGPVWSLMVEIQFYLLLPLVAAALGRLSRGSPRRVALLVGALGIALLGVRLVTVTQTQHTLVWQYSLPATAVFFVPGMLLALLRLHWDSVPAALRRSPLGAAPLWLLTAVALLLAVLWRYSWDALLLPACFLLIGACTLPLRGTAALRWLDWRPLGLLGVASYSLYLWHEPLVAALARATWLPGGFGPLVVASAVVAVAVAAVSYRLVERPFLQLRRQWQPRREALRRSTGRSSLPPVP